MEKAGRGLLPALQKAEKSKAEGGGDCDWAGEPIGLISACGRSAIFGDHACS